MKKNLAKKALLPAVAMALASVIALSGVTYAWFTTGSTATVGNLDVNVQVAKGIQVSLDATFAGDSLITAEEIIAARDNTTIKTDIQYIDGVQILPVSTAGYIGDNGRMNMYLGTLNSDNTLKSEISEEKETGNFIAFDLYFKVTEKQTLKLDGTVKCIDLADGGKDSDRGTEKAVRVAFIQVEDASGKKGFDTAAEARNAKAAKGSKATVIWEPNASEHISAVTDNGISGIETYKGFKSEFSGVAAADLTAEQAETVTVETGSAFELFELAAGINKVRIYIWLEGQDVDCLNDISYADFATSLKFSVDEK